MILNDNGRANINLDEFIVDIDYCGDWGMDANWIGLVRNYIRGNNINILCNDI